MCASNLRGKKMPNRILRDGILKSESINSLSAQAELFYRRLMSVVDDYGCYEARINVLRLDCFGLQIDKIREADIARWLTECEKAGVILLYKVEDKPYLQIIKFGVTPRSKPKFPLPQTSAHNCAQLRPYSHSFAPSNAPPSGGAGAKLDGAAKRAAVRDKILGGSK